MTATKKKLKPNDLLFYHRTIRHIPVHELAKKTGISATHILHMENGDEPMDEDTVKRLAAGIGVNPSQIWHGRAI